MRKFEGHRSVDQVQHACEEKGLHFDKTAFEKGSDYVRIDGAFAGVQLTVLYSSWNGKFLGTLPGGTTFSSDLDEHDGQPWFDALLDFFYVGPLP